MPERILQAMEREGLVHKGYTSPHDPVALRILEERNPVAFYRKLCEVVNPLFHPSLEFFVNKDALCLKRHKFNDIPPKTLEIGRIRDRISYPLRIISAILSPKDIRVRNGRPHISKSTYFDRYGKLILVEPNFEYSSYHGTATLLTKIVNLSLPNYQITHSGSAQTRQ